MNRLLFLLILLGLSYSAKATHIIGGDIGYRCLGDNQYEIVLQVYRDCYNGDPGAPFDDPAAVGIFDRNGLLLHTAYIPFIEDDTVTNLPAACVVVPGDVCVHTTTYRDTVTLRPRKGGYQLAYQRCCRNETINNIVDPLETGATYTVWLTEEAMARCNTTPFFKEWPSIFICANQDLVFDHSATDADGDSLVYKLCVPNQGATFADPKPQPPNNPPYDTLVFIQPTYSLENMLGFGDPLTINPETGLLTANPGMLGQFVVGICVEEYDRETKQLISRVNRDFQYNVIDCENITAAFFAPETLCETLEVDLENKSIGADDFTWLFDAPGMDLVSMESARDFSFTYPDTGLYTISLIAEPNTICADTFSRDIFLGSPDTYLPDTLIVCDGDSVQLNPSTPATIPFSYQWSGPGIVDPTARNPVVLPASGNATYNVTISAAEGNCYAEATVVVLAAEAADLEMEITSTCEGLEYNFVNKSSGADSYKWIIGDPSEPDFTSSEDAFLYTFPDTGAFDIMLIAEGICPDTLIQTFQANDIDLSFKIGFAYLDNCPMDTVNVVFRDIQTTSSEGIVNSYYWELEDGRNSTERNPVFGFNESGTYGLTFIYGIEGQCFDTVTTDVNINLLRDLVEEFQDTIVVCQGEPTQINPDFSLGYQYQWTPAEGLSSAVIPNPEFSPETTTTYTLDISKNGDICQTLEVVAFVPDSIQLEVTGERDNCGLSGELTATTAVSTTISWQTPEGVELGTGTTFTPDENTPGQIVVIATDAFGCVDSQNIQLGSDLLSADFNIQQLGCGVEGALLSFTDASLNNTGEALSWSWSFSDGQTSTDANPVILVTSSQSLQVTLSVGAGDNCMDQITKTLDVKVVQVPLQDTIVNCGGGVFLNPDGPADQVYEWTPAAGIDDTSVANPFVNPTTTTTYEVTTYVIGLDTCRESGTVTVIIGDDGSFTVSAPDDLFTCGEPVELTANATGADRFSWRKLDGEMVGEGAAISVNPDTIETYIVTATSVSGCTAEDTVTVTNNGVDIALQTEAEFNACPGQFIQIGVTNNDIRDTLTYNWLPVAAVSSGGNTANPVVSIGDTSIVFTGIATNQFGCVDSVQVRVNIGPFEVNLPDTVLVCGAEPTELAPNANSNYTYQWSPDTLLSNPAVRNPVFNGTEEAIYTYSVTVTDPGASELCESVEEVVVVVSQAVDIVPNDVPELVCGLDSVEMIATVPDQEVSIEWFADQAMTDVISTGEVLRVEAAAGVNTYFAKAINKDGCTDVERYTFEATPFDPQVESPLEICYNTPTPINTTADAEYTYEWLPTTGLDLTNPDNPLATLTGNMNYQVVVTKTGTTCSDTLLQEIIVRPEIELTVSNDTTLCAGEELTLTAIAPTALTIEWFDENERKEGEGNTLLVTPQESGLYIARVVDSIGCVQRDTVAVDVIIVDPMLPDTVQVCIDQPRRLNPGGNDSFTYVWTPETGLDLSDPANPVVTTDMDQRYTVQVTDPATGCTTTDSVQVVVNELPIVTTASDTTVCTTDALTISATATEGAMISWETISGGALGNGNSIDVTPVFGENTYIARATSEVGCNATDTLTVTVIEFDPGISNPVTVCFDEPSPINPAGNAEYTYQWSPADELDLSDNWNPLATLTENTTFMVTVTDGVCIIDTSLMVEVQTVPEVSAGADTTVCSTDPLTLNASGECADTFQWFDADGNPLGSGMSIDVTPAQTGDNLFVVEATSKSGETARDSVIVTVIDFMPELTSPVSVCKDQPGAINPNGNTAFNYVWSPADNLDQADAANPMATLQMDAVFYVTITDQNGCMAIDSVQVDVFTVEDSGLPTTIEACYDTPTALNPAANTGFEYKWVPEDGLDLTDPANPLAALTENTTYQVIITDPETTCMDTVEQEVMVRPEIELVVTNDTTLCAGDSLALMATAPALVSIEWSDANATTIGTGSPLMVMPEASTQYFVEVIDTAGCMTMDTVNVEVIIVDPMLPDTIIACNGQPTELNPGGNTAFEYVWTPATNLDMADIANPTVTTTTPLQYIVSVTDPENGCMIMDTVQVDVPELPVIVAAPDTTVCETTPLSISATSDAAISWTDMDGNALGTGESVEVSPQVGDNSYIATATDDNGCMASDTILVTVIDFDPVIGDMMDTLTVCFDEPTPLNPNGNPDLIYTWTPDDQLDLTQPWNPIGTFTEDITLMVSITDSTGVCSIDTSLAVKVQRVPEVMAGNDTTVCTTDPLPLSASGVCADGFVWFNTEGDTLGMGMDITVTPETGENLYIVEATSKSGESARDTVLVEVLDFDPGLTSPVQVCEGQDEGINPNGNSSYEYQWEPADQLDLTNPANPVVNLTEDATFFVTVTDMATGCVAIDTIEVEVIKVPEVDAGQDTTICQNESVVLMATGRCVDTYEWFDLEGSAIGTGESVEVNPEVGESCYVVVATDFNGDTAQDTVCVNVQAFDPMLTSPVEVCANQPSPINPDGNTAYDYEWSPTDNLDLTDPDNPLATISDDMTFKVTVTDMETGCTTETEIEAVVKPELMITEKSSDTLICATAELELFVETNGADTIRWFADAELMNEIGDGNTVAVTPEVGQNVYYIEATDACGTTIDSIVVEIPDLSDGVPMDSVTVCAGVASPINADGNAAYTYQWSPAEFLDDATAMNPMATVDTETDFFATVTDPVSGCMVMDTITAVPAPPINPSAGADTTLCSTEPFTLSGDGTDATGFEWSTNPNFDPVESTEQDYSLNPAEGETTYYLRVTNSAGCTEVDSIVLNVRPVKASIPELYEVCLPGDRANLMVTNEDETQELQYLWMPEDLFISSPVEGPGAEIEVEQDTDVELLLENQFGCTLDLTTRVEIVDLPNRLTIMATDTLLVGDETTDIIVDGCEDCTYEWSPADGLDRTDGPRVIADPDQTTDYQVIVRRGECTDTLTITIRVATPCEEPYIFVPRAFTPNGDGMNDLLFVRGDQVIDEMHFIVYNRWGQEVFDTRDITVGWDGSFEGKDLPPDVYGYWLRVTCIDGSTFEKRGNVTLFR